MGVERKRIQGGTWAAMAGVALAAAAARADTVVLQSGAVLTGEIVGENARELRLLVSRTADGGIQTTKTIAQSLVATVQRGGPEVAVEPEPGTPTGGVATVRAPVASPRAPPADLAELQAAVKEADTAAGAGRHDEAILTYRDTIAACDQEVARPRGATPAPDDALAWMRLRDETYAQLLVALKGRLQVRQAALDEVEDRVQQQAREIGRRRDELDDVQRRRSGDDARVVYRLGQDAPEAKEAVRARDLREQIAKLEARQAAQAKWAEAERIALVNLENEIQLTRQRARQAADAHAQAQRENRDRR